MNLQGVGISDLVVRIFCSVAVLCSACSVEDEDRIDAGQVPIMLVPEAKSANRWKNACAVDIEQQLRLLDPEPFVHELWYQTPGLDAPPFPPNLTHKGILTMSRCHIQGTHRLRKDGYMVFSANSQDRERGEGDRKWSLNRCSSIPSLKGGGAHLFVAHLNSYKSKPGFAWREQIESKPGTPTNHQIVKNVRLSVNDIEVRPDFGSLDALWHPGGIDGVGDFVYVGIDGLEHKSYLKIFDMSDPTGPVLVGGREFTEHKSQAFGATDLVDGRVLLAVVDTYRGKRKVHFYIEDRAQESGEVLRHRFTRAGRWEHAERNAVESTRGFPFLKYQSLALLRECGSGDIYLVAVHNDRRLRCGGLLEVPGYRAPTRLDLYRVGLPEEFGPDAEFRLDRILRRNIRDHKGEGCAGATAHVTPEGQIIAYTIEHGGHREFDAGRYPEGLKRWVGKIQFYEYSNRVVVAKLVDGDKVEQRQDMCPDEAEDVDGFADGDGCPDEDNDADGIADAVDRCPNVPEDRDGIDDADGCVDPDDTAFPGKRVVISRGNLFGDRGNGSLSEAGRFLVTGLVNWWREQGHADICVFAHTNRYGDEEAERIETERWADTVRQAIIQKGVSATRIHTEGFGASQLVVPPADPSAERLNSRVEIMQCVQ